MGSEMQDTEVKAYAFKKLRFCVAIVLLALVAFTLSIIVDSKSTSRETYYYNDLEAMKDKLQEQSELLDKYKKAIVVWNSGLKDTYSQRKGLDLAAAKRITDDLRILHNIKSLSIVLTSPTPRKDIYGLEFTQLIYSRINIELEAYSDKDVIRFIDGFIDKLPGILQSVNTQMVLVDDDKRPGKKIIDAKIEILWENVADNPVAL